MTRRSEDEDPRVVPLAEALARVRTWQAAGLRVAAASGAFDLLHQGHLSLLRRARSEADRLVVALHDDDTVRASRGPDRPVHPAADRAELIAAVQAVDLVTILGKATPAALIADIQPDVVVTGTDVSPDPIVGYETVLARGGRVVQVPSDPGESSTALIVRIRQQS